MPYRIFTTREYEEWICKETGKSRRQIAIRITNIIKEGYFGESKRLDNSIWELKWKNGRRIYYSYILEHNVILLLGGNKNGQEKDIIQARKIYIREISGINRTKI